MTKKNSPKATTKPANAEKSPVAKTATEESKAAPKPTADKNKTFPLYTLLTASAIVLVTFIATKDLGKDTANDTSTSARNVEKPALHILSDEGDAGELTPVELDNILTGKAPIIPNAPKTPESFLATGPKDTLSTAFPPQDDLEAEQDALEDMIDDAVDEGVSGQQIDKIERKFSTLSKKVQKLRTENHSLKRHIEALKQQQYKTSMEAAVSGLHFAIMNGDNFEAPLMQLTKMQNTPIAISRGIATLDALPTRQVIVANELNERFVQTARDYQQNVATNEDASIWQKTMNNLTSSIHIRKVGGNHKGDDDGAILARAEAQLDAGDIDEALIELNNLSPDAAEFFASWITMAQEHRAATSVAKRMLNHIQKGASS